MGDMNGPLGGSSSKDRSEEYMADEAEPEPEPQSEAQPKELETSRLLELANSIQTQVSQIQKYLTETKQPNPRFEADTPLTEWHGIDDTRSACLENLTQLQDLLMTPREMLHTQAPTNLASRHAIDRFKIHRLIPLSGSKSYEDLAWATMLPVKTLRRLLRHAMAQRIFYEPSPGHVAHTHASALLASNAAVRDYFGTICNDAWPAATRIVDAVETWPGGKGKDESGYVLAHGRTMYEALAAEPAKQVRYDSAMDAFSDDRSFSTAHLVQGFDWAGLGEGTVVDVGGGIGSASRALARKFAKLKFVVQDQESVVKNAVVEDEAIASRVSFCAHDFFQAQPVRDADVYFFRRVMMEWTDEKCVDMIKALTPALKKGALVQVQDPYLGPPGSYSLWQERKFRDSDLLALAVANAGAREEEQWESIFKLAGPGFEFKGVRTVAGSNIAFIEAVWVGEELSQSEEAKEPAEFPESMEFAEPDEASEQVQGTGSDGDVEPQPANGALGPEQEDDSEAKS